MFGGYGFTAAVAVLSNTVFRYVVRSNAMFSAARTFWLSSGFLSVFSATKAVMNAGVWTTVSDLSVFASVTSCGFGDRAI